MYASAVIAVVQGSCATRLSDQPHTYNNGGFIYQQGDPAHCSLEVKSGLVFLCRLDTNGKRTGFWVIEPGESFGEEALQQIARRHTAVAISDGTRVAPTAKGHEDRVLAHAHARAHFLENIWQHSARGGTFRRVALVLEQYHGLDIPRETLAELAACRIETLSRFRQRQRQSETQR